jgi:tetratricopeptide (TPR) repeat protein
MDIKCLSLSPEKITEELQMLVNAARQSSHFSIWSEVFRALAYYDRRQDMSILWEQLTNRDDKKEGIPGAQTLVLTEAGLECARPLAALESLLESLDIQHCSPLTPETAHLWQQWLLAELSWWKDDHTDGLEAFAQQLTGLLKNPPPQLDPSMTKEWQQLIFRGALLCARSAIARGDCSKAGEWLAQIDGIEVDTGLPTGLWELDYLQGMHLWSRGELQLARSYLEKSLSLNPFQSRVRFELNLLDFFQEPSSTKNSTVQSPTLPLPGVHDVLAAGAVALFKKGQLDQTRQYLEQMDQPETAYSLSLVWPEARKLRLEQGKQLCAYMAETRKEWQTALHLWDAVPPEAGFLGSRLTHQAHQLYLLGKHLEQIGDTGEIGETSEANKDLHIHFHKELGKLAIRPITGEAMFYRGLAAEKSMPQRATVDFRALLRQPGWLEKSRKDAPERLIYIGDFLLKAGLGKDAYKAYHSVNPDSPRGARERQLLGNLILRFPPDPAAAASILDKVKHDEHPPKHDNPLRDLVQEAGEKGLILVDEWKVFLYLYQSLQTALTGDFEAAETIRGKALDLLTPGSTKEKKNEDNI